MANILYRESMTPDVRTESSIKNNPLTYQELDTNLFLINEELEQASSDIEELNQTVALKTDILFKQFLSVEYTDNVDVTGIIPLDDTKPQDTEGFELLTLTVTPKSVTSKLIIEFRGQVCLTDDGVFMAALIEDLTVDSFFATAITSKADELSQVNFKVVVPSTTLDARTYKLIVGTDTSNVFRFNGSISSRLFGGVSKSILSVTEVE